MKRSVRIVVVGFGHWGPNIVRSLQRNEDAEVVGIVDSSSVQLDKIVNLFPDLKFFDSFESALSAVDFDAVAVATPTETHYQLGMQILSAGKHLLMEKPLAHATDAARDLTTLAENNSLVLMTGHVFLYNDAVKKMKAVVDSGELGEVLYLRSLRSNLGPIRSDVNALWDLAAHDISIFNYLYGTSPLRVSCTGFAPLGLKQHDLAQGSLEYPGNRVATFFVSWLDPQKQREVTVVGDKKMLTFNDMNPEQPLRVYDKGARVIPQTPYADTFQSFRTSIHQGEVRLLETGTGEPLKNECDHFVACVRDKTAPLTDGDNGTDVVRILEALTRSLHDHGAPVSVWSPQSAHSYQHVSDSKSASV